MKNRCQIFYLLILVLISSCKNEDYINENTVFAGEVKSSYIYHEFSPVLIVKTKLDTLSGFSAGRDSIDLNLDGNFDMIINLFLHPNDTAFKTGGKYFYPFCRLLFKNGFEVANKGFQYACGHGICNYAPFVDALEYDTDISHYPDWYSGDKEQTMWIITPAGSGYPPGWWYYAENKEMFVGIRQKHAGSKKSFYYNYGWIKLYFVSHHNMSFISYAMEY